MGLDKSWTLGASWAKHFKLRISLKKNQILETRGSFSARKIREREGEKDRRPRFSL